MAINILNQNLVSSQPFAGTGRFLAGLFNFLTREPIVNQFRASGRNWFKTITMKKKRFCFPRCLLRYYEEMRNVVSCACAWWGGGGMKKERTNGNNNNNKSFQHRQKYSHSQHLLLCSKNTHSINLIQGLPVFLGSVDVAWCLYCTLQLACPYLQLRYILLLHKVTQCFSILQMERLQRFHFFQQHQ